MKDNIFPDSTPAQVALDKIQKEILGEDWYVVDPLCNDQVNTIIVDEVIRKWREATGYAIKKKWNKIISKLLCKI